MFFNKYLLFLEIEDMARICSKPYGFKLLILLYNQTKKSKILVRLNDNLMNEVCKIVEIKHNLNKVYFTARIVFIV
jgi:hypothetical protein